MATKWEIVDQTVLKVIDNVIRKYKPELAGVPIGVLFRDDTPSSKGKEVWTKIEKVSEKNKPLMSIEGIELILWISKPAWLSLSPEDKIALIHHELCHVDIDLSDETLRLVGHDVEEFDEVIREHGLWKSSLKSTATVFQEIMPGFGKETDD